MPRFLQILLIGFCFLAVTAQAGDDSPLIEAVKKGDKAKVEELLSQGADVNAKGSFGQNALHQAAYWNQKDIAKLLLSKGADVNARDSNGRTPLHLAALRNSKDISELFLINGADVNARDNRGITPLYEVVINADKVHVALLLAKGAVVNANVDVAGRNTSPLWWAIRLTTMGPSSIGVRDDSQAKKEVVEILEEHVIKNERNPRELLRQLTEQLRNDPENESVNPRRLIVKLASRLKPAPAIPEEARRHFVEGSTIVKAGKNPAEQALAAQSFNEALKIAPWWPDAWYNFAVAQELAGKFVEAEKSFTLYILSSPGEKEQREAQDRIYALSAKRKLSGGK